MTVDQRIQAFEDACRAEGLPVTFQRRAVLEALLQRDDHPTADQLLDIVRERVPGISRTTVYRVLELLVRVGVIRRAPHLGAAARFDPKTHRHHHLVCVDCGRVEDFEDPDLDRFELPDASDRGMRLLDYSVSFMGLCTACDSEAGAGKRGRS